MNGELYHADYEFDYGGTPVNQAIIVNHAKLFESIDETITESICEDALATDEIREFTGTYTGSMVTSEARRDGNKLSDAYEITYTVVVDGSIRGTIEGYELQMPIEVSIDATDREGNPF